MPKKKITSVIIDLRKKGFTPAEILREIERTDPSRLTKKTFEVDRDLLFDFYKIQKKSGLKVKEAVDQALREWITKRLR